MTQANFPYTIGETVDLAVTVDVNEWNGEQRVSVKVRDIHLSGIDYDKIHHSEQVYQRLVRSEPVEPPRGRPQCPIGRYCGGIPLSAYKRKSARAG